MDANTDRWRVGEKRGDLIQIMDENDNIIAFVYKSEKVAKSIVEIQKILNLLKLAYLELIAVDGPEFDLDAPLMRRIKSVLEKEGVEV